MSAFWDDVRALFLSASECDARQRAELLRSADPEVRKEVDSLLAAHDEPSPFLEKSVFEMLDVGRSIGPYRVLHQLGSGGMGTVFLAVRDSAEFAQRVAVKVVRGGEALVQRFRQERQILAALEHPNIARLLDGGTTADGLPYLVMEFVEGTPIDDYCAGLAVNDRLKLFLELCDAVQYAHRSLIIHRDIKPANILVTSDGTPKLLDFGIARLVSQTEETSTRVMTPDYASPEQLLGRAITTASDVYSLGVLLFELLTQRKPFTNREPLSEAPRPGLNADLDSIVMTAMEVDPARRYGTVDKLADDVRRYLAQRPIHARRATFRYRTIKFVRRNALAVIAAAVVAVVTATAFVVTLHQKRIAERRFAEVRSLAHAVVFELHDAIAPLPGSTHARELLVRRALVYLDTLADEASANAPLQMELARAYMKVGDVQGAPYRANLGDTAGAIASYRKALTIAKRVADDEPENGEAVTVAADAHDRLGLVEQRALRWKEALALHETARKLRESLPPSPKRDIALAQTWTAIGDCRYIGGAPLPDAQRAYENALATLARVPRTPQLQRDVLVELARANQRLGGFFSGRQRDLGRAIRHHDAALQALAERAALDPTDFVARRNLADQWVMKATAQNIAEDGAGALQSATRGLAMLKLLALADAKNVEAQHDLAFAYGEQGTALFALGRYGEAEDAFAEAVAIRERLIAADPSNLEDLRDLKRVRASLQQAQQHAR